MKKPFIAYLYEQESDHDYVVRAIEDIRSEEIMGKIKAALMQHGVIEVKKGSYAPYKEENPYFPKHPYSPTYTVEVTLSNDVNPNLIQQNLSQFINFPIDFLSVTRKGEDEPPKQDESPDVSDAEAQNMVGQNRISDLIKDLNKASEERVKSTEDALPEVLEAFVVPAKALEGLLEHTPRRGFYLVEQYSDDRGMVSGPFQKFPENYPLVETLAEGIEFVSENVLKSGIRMIEVRTSDVAPIKMPPHQYNDQSDIRVFTPKMQKYAVEVVDSDTGQVYNVVVNAGSETAARNKAVFQVSKETMIGDSRLMAKKPKLKDSVN